jgi:type I restriction enzyme, R subunit
LPDVLPTAPLLVVDFVNDPEEILAAFKTYYETAELTNVTDPNLVFDLGMKLDATGYYDEFEVNRAVEVEFNPHAKQSDLTGALEPVLSRRLQRCKAAQDKLKVATSKEDGKTATDAQNELNALMLIKHERTDERHHRCICRACHYEQTGIGFRESA